MLTIRWCRGNRLPEPGEPAGPAGGTGRPTDTNQFLKETIRTPKASLVGEQIHEKKPLTGPLLDVATETQFQHTTSLTQLAMPMAMGHGHAKAIALAIAKVMSRCWRPH